jgi:hypothetical protein
MNGAMADPLAKTINAPKPKRITIRGNNQNFFRFFKNPHKSVKKFKTESS